MKEDAIRRWQERRPGGPSPIGAACHAPWVTMEFDPAGWVMACCGGQTYPLGRIGDDRLIDLWHGDRATALRDALLRWDLTVNCVGCRWHLERGRLDPIAALYDDHPVGDRPANPLVMQFALSNRCNLACLMCNAELSSRHAAEAGLVARANPYDDTYFADLEHLLGGLQLAKFQGGEPFLVPEHKRVWDLLAALPERPRVHVTTNGTVWNATVESVLDRFDTDISVSIDAATPETYRVVRRGGELAEVHENVDRFAAYCRARGTGFHTSFCLQLANAHELGPYLRWAERFETTVSINLVSDDGLAVHDLPADDLAAVRGAWEAERADLEPALHRNLEVWRTQLRQADAVLADKATDGGAVRAQPVPATSLELLRPTGRRPRRRARAAIEAREVEALERWSGGVVAVLGLDGDRIASVERARPDLGLDAGVAGRDVADLVAVLGAADGRQVWSLDGDRFDQHAVTVVGLSSTATRGTPGRVVRLVAVHGRPTWTLLVAVDDFHERNAVRVQVGRRSAGG